MLILIQVCLHDIAIHFFPSVSHSLRILILALGHCCILLMWRQFVIWWGRCIFPGPAHEHFNSPNMFCFLELNQYKLKVHAVFLAESFQVDDEVGLPVAGWDQPRTTHCVPSSLSKPNLAHLSPGTDRLPARPWKMTIQITSFSFRGQDYRGESLVRLSFQGLHDMKV